ncbi:MAG: hypothetical protein K0U93_11925 [Gammaproteobacteria bacterium]|nr:hypothetical protein [Gammaproteobacteria bacterium]
MNEQVDFSRFKLGEDDQVIALATSAENRCATLGMLAHATRSIDIVSRDFDRAILNDAQIEQALRDFVRNGTRPSVRVLVHDLEQAVRHGHALLELAKRLTSFISIRRLGEPHKTYNEAFTVIDARAYIHRSHAARFEAKACFSDRKRARDLTLAFDEMWQSSDSEADARAFII